MITSLLILKRAVPLEYGNQWLVSWSEADEPHEKEFEAFEDVSRFVEGQLLASATDAKKPDLFVDMGLADEPINLDDIPF